MNSNTAEAYLAEAAKRTQVLLRMYSAIEPALAAFAAANNLSVANGDSVVPRVITDHAFSGEIHKEIVVVPRYVASNPGFRVYGYIWYDEQMEGGSRELQPMSRHAQLIPLGEWAFDASSLEGLEKLLRQAKDSVFRPWTAEEITAI